MPQGIPIKNSRIYAMNGQTEMKRRKKEVPKGKGLVLLHGPGGDTIEAIKIGIILRKHFNEKMFTFGSFGVTTHPNVNLTQFFIMQCCLVVGL